MPCRQQILQLPPDGIISAMTDSVTLNNIAMLEKKKVTSVVSNDYILWIQADGTARNTPVSLEKGQILEQKSFPFVNL